MIDPNNSAYGNEKSAEQIIEDQRAVIKKYQFDVKQLKIKLETARHDAAKVAVRAQSMYVDLAHAKSELAEAEAESVRLNALINSPHVDDFIEAIKLEAAHQTERWDVESDAGKTPEDWMWLVAYLSTKATQAAKYDDTDKYHHHIITAAAAILNWHQNARGTNPRMRAGAGHPEATLPDDAT